MKESNGTNYYRVAVVARELGIPVPTLKRWIQDGKVEVRTFGLAPKSPHYISEHEKERIKALVS